MVLCALVLFSLRNSIHVRSWKWRRLLLLVAGGITAAAAIVLFKYFAKPIELLATFLAIAGYITAFWYNCIFYYGGEKRWRSMYAVFWLYDYVLGLAILCPFYLVSFVSLAGDFHTRVMYNASFSKLLQVSALPHSDHFSSCGATVICLNWFVGGRAKASVEYPGRQ